MARPGAAPLVLALAACTVERTGSSIMFERTRDEAGRFVADVTAGRHADAHRRLCPDVAARQSVDTVRRVTVANPFLQPGATLDAHLGRTIHGATELEGALTTGTVAVRVWFYFSTVDDRVCLTGALVGGTPLFPAYGTDAPPAEAAR